MKASLLCGAHYAGAAAHRPGVLPDACDPNVAQESFERWLGYAAMADEQGDVRTEAADLERDSLDAQIRRAAAVRIRNNRGHALGEQRLTLLQPFVDEAFGGMRMHVDEPGGDVAIAGIDGQRRRGPRQLADGGDVAVSLTGHSGAPANLVITPMSSDFGTVVVGTSNTLSFTLQNTGGVDLTDVQVTD